MYDTFLRHKVAQSNGKESKDKLVRSNLLTFVLWETCVIIFSSKKTLLIHISGLIANIFLQLTGYSFRISYLL
jgi:hypothetical protein